MTVATAVSVRPPELPNPHCSFSQRGIHCPALQLDPQQQPRLIEIIRNLRERVTEVRATGWLGEVEGLQVSLNAAVAKLTSLDRTSADGCPQLLDLGMPLFTDPPAHQFGSTT
ncbi:hypothetical protein SAMN05216489_00485 [Streptomyces sp. 3213]|uniref:hypothetical protein n=1 Tax=Streptomyces sp. 3213.3 TaxID=1855348 RepID=UPI000896BB48|nr:hypothetical protein [Streptomyces sp. 3213.3]SEC34095.1 hypothetical protein SAMN05216489_00485 [Streptomyces sp. 3213] [Streptomyces sp. 3213.3]